MPSGKAKVRSLVEIVGATMLAVRCWVDEDVILRVWVLLSYMLAECDVLC